MPVRYANNLRRLWRPAMTNDSFCSYPEGVMMLMFAITGSFMFAIWGLTLTWWLFLGIPVIWGLYFWYVEPTWPFDYTREKEIEKHG